MEKSAISNNACASARDAQLSQKVSDWICFHHYLRLSVRSLRSYSIWKLFKKKLLRQISIFFCSFLLDFSPILCNYIINNNHHHIHVTLDDEQTTLFFYSAKMPFHQKNNENKYFISCYRITEKGSQIVIIYPGPGTLQFEIWVPKYSFITLKFFRFWIFLSKNCSWGFIISKWHNFWTILILNLIITLWKKSWVNELSHKIFDFLVRNVKKGKFGQ